MGEILASIERSAHLIGACIERQARELGITQAEAHVLIQLARHGPTSIAALHREFGTKRSTLTNVLDRLERRGLIRRELSENDRRSFTIHLTDDGTAPARRVAAIADDLDAAIRSRVDERDIQGLETVVAALAAILDETP